MTTFATHVHFTKKDGTVQVLEAGQTVPGWAKNAITNPSAFAPEVEEEAKPDLDKKAPEKTPEELAAEAADDDLRKQLADKGLETDGTHEELVARLADHGE